MVGRAGSSEGCGACSAMRFLKSLFAVLFLILLFVAIAAGTLYLLGWHWGSGWMDYGMG